MARKNASSTRLGTGSACYLKRGRVPVVIVAADAYGTWTVDVVDNNGERKPDLQKTGVKTQQLAKPKPGENHPLLHKQDITETTTTATDQIGEVTQKKTCAEPRLSSLVQEAGQGQDPGRAAVPHQPTSTTTPAQTRRGGRGRVGGAAASLGRNIMRRLTPRKTQKKPANGDHENDEATSDDDHVHVAGSNSSLQSLWQAYQSGESLSEEEQTALTTGLESHWDESTEDADDMAGDDDVAVMDSVQDEDFPFIPPDEEEAEIVGDAIANILAMGQDVEENVDTDKYKLQKAKYQEERAILVAAPFTVTCDPPKNKDPLDIGDKVEERSGEKRKGVIVDRSASKDNGKKKPTPCWVIQFDGEPGVAAGIPSTKIKRVRDTRKFTWTCIEDSHPTDPVQDFAQSGVIGFDFATEFAAEKLAAEHDSNYNFPFAKLFKHLWPGDWRQQLRNMNLSVEDANSYLRAKNSMKKLRSLVTEHEWWTAWGIIILAGPLRKGGKKLFENQGLRKMVPSINLGTGEGGEGIMSWDRFSFIKKNFSFAFYDKSNAEDPWHPIRLLLDGFNDNRSRTVASAVLITLDETMSPFQPRTTKTSLLPHLSYIFRKPKPLGTEFKSTACTETQMKIHLELQRGKTAMKTQRFHGDVGATAACTLRLILESAYCGTNLTERKDALSKGRRYLFLADSWFGSVRCAEALKLLWPKNEEPHRSAPVAGGSSNNKDIMSQFVIDHKRGPNPNGHELIAAVKTNSGWFPKDEIEEKMEKWPCGSTLVMECKTPETGVELVALGYKYNKKSVLTFIMTKNAGSTALGNPGTSYYAKFSDVFRNVKQREVERPAVLDTYFRNSNVIDMHNHARQHCLGLERHWRTTCPWFSIDTTFVGMTVVDAWKALRYHLRHRYGNMSVDDFVDCLTWDLIHNHENKEVPAPRGYIEADASYPEAFEVVRHQGPDLHSIQTGEAAKHFSDVVFHYIQDKISATASAAASSTVSPTLSMVSSLTSGSVPPPVFFVGAGSNAHDATTNNGTKRRCSVCGCNTRWLCSHPDCLRESRAYNGGYTLVCHCAQ